MMDFFFFLSNCFMANFIYSITVLARNFLRGNTRIFSYFVLMPYLDRNPGFTSNKPAHYSVITQRNSPQKWQKQKTAVRNSKCYCCSKKIPENCFLSHATNKSLKFFVVFVVAIKELFNLLCFRIFELYTHISSNFYWCFGLFLCFFVCFEYFSFASMQVNIFSCSHKTTSVANKPDFCFFLVLLLFAKNMLTITKGFKKAKITVNPNKTTNLRYPTYITHKKRNIF